MRAEDVENARFQPTKLRTGYDQGQVDDLLDRIAATLRAGDQAVDATSAREATMARFGSARAAEPDSAATITADEVAASRFTPTRFRDGYDQNQVDDFLMQVVVELRRRATR